MVLSIAQEQNCRLSPAVCNVRIKEPLVITLLLSNAIGVEFMLSDLFFLALHAAIAEAQDELATNCCCLL